MARKSKALRLHEQILTLKEQLHDHQQRCKHPTRHRTYKLGGSQGNYDPTQDCYWTDYQCGLCLKRWTVMDQNGLVGKRVSCSS